MGHQYRRSGYWNPTERVEWDISIEGVVTVTLLHGYRSKGRPGLLVDFLFYIILSFVCKPVVAETTHWSFHSLRIINH